MAFERVCVWDLLQRELVPDSEGQVGDVEVVPGGEEDLPQTAADGERGGIGTGARELQSAQRDGSQPAHGEVLLPASHGEANRSPRESLVRFFVPRPRSVGRVARKERMHFGG